MKTPGQIAFEAYQEVLAGGTLHRMDRSTVHLQPWDSVDSRQRFAWEAAAQAVNAPKETPSGS